MGGFLSELVPSPTVLTGANAYMGQIWQMFNYGAWAGGALPAGAHVCVYLLCSPSTLFEIGKYDWPPPPTPQVDNLWLWIEPPARCLTLKPPKPQTPPYPLPPPRTPQVITCGCGLMPTCSMRLG